MVKIDFWKRFDQDQWSTLTIWKSTFGCVLTMINARDRHLDTFNLYTLINFCNFFSPCLLNKKKIPLFCQKYKVATYYGKPNNQPSPNSSQHMWKYVNIVGGGAVFLIVVAIMLCICRSNAVSTIGPRRTEQSGQLQKAYIIGVPELNQLEQETACEDFSNIIITIDGCNVYKVTLSRRVEIAIASTSIDTLSRANHKNFVHLIGFCEENEPFVRMWCLSMLLMECSLSICTIIEMCSCSSMKSKNKIKDDKENSELTPSADPETNVYSFAAGYLNEKRSISYRIDPSLKSFKNNELDAICEVIQDCIQPDPRQRPTMKETTSRIRDVITISPDQATPMLSPLWWTELEILSVEKT
ncbi:hypothetical protein UlMin_023661 [Ulmus minor]